MTTDQTTTITVPTEVLNRAHDTMRKFELRLRERGDRETAHSVATDADTLLLAMLGLYPSETTR